MKQKQTTPAEETEDKRPNETPDGDSSDGESSDGEFSDGLKEAGESMLSHLMALRKVLLISAAAVLIGFVLVFYLAIDPLMAQILAPIQARGIQVIFTTMSEALVTKFKVALQLSDEAFVQTLTEQKAESRRRHVHNVNRFLSIVRQWKFLQHITHMR